MQCLKEYIAKLEATQPAIHPTETSTNRELAHKGGDAPEGVRAYAHGPRSASKRPRDT